MNAKTLILAGVTALSLAAPLLAHADPDGWRGGERGDRGYYAGNGGRDNRYGERGGDRRDGDRRGYGSRERWDRDGRWGQQRRCWVTERGYYEPDGDYITRPVTICR